jgi:hypothetical protein
MTIDPNLEALFSKAVQDFDGDAFAHEVMAQVDAERRRTLLFWSGLGIAATVVLALLASPVLTAIEMATRFLPTSLVEIETGWLQQLLSPINSIAAVIAIGVLAIRKFVRSIFG